MQRVTCWEWLLWPLSASVAKCKRKWVRGIADIISYTILLPWSIIGVLLAGITALVCGLILIISNWWKNEV